MIEALTFKLSVDHTIYENIINNNTFLSIDFDSLYLSSVFKLMFSLKMWDQTEQNQRYCCMKECYMKKEASKRIHWEQKTPAKTSQERTAVSVKI